MIKKVFKGTYTMCRCKHFKTWIEGQAGGCKECLKEEYPLLTLKTGVLLTKNGKYYIPGKGFIKPADALI